MKVVEFNNGKYAIRKLTLFGYRYYSLSCHYWWSIDSCASYCQGDFDTVLARFHDANDYGTPIKI